MATAAKTRPSARLLESGACFLAGVALGIAAATFWGKHASRRALRHWEADTGRWRPGSGYRRSFERVTSGGETLRTETKLDAIVDLLSPGNADRVSVSEPLTAEQQERVRQIIREERDAWRRSLPALNVRYPAAAVYKASKSGARTLGVCALASLVTLLTLQWIQS